MQIVAIQASSHLPALYFIQFKELKSFITYAFPFQLLVKLKNI